MEAANSIRPMRLLMGRTFLFIVGSVSFACTSNGGFADSDGLRTEADGSVSAPSPPPIPRNAKDTQCVGFDCCPLGQNPVVGTDDGEKLKGGSNDDCLHGLAGSDDLKGHHGADTLFGGGNDDKLQGGHDADAIFGGLGPDDLLGQAGDDILVGGPGVDTLNGGPGDDVFVIYDTCEIEAGESIQGSSGADTLISPLSLEDLEALGVSVQSVETIEVDTSIGFQSDCYCGHGQVEEINDVGVTCACDPGWMGLKCDMCASAFECVEREDVLELTELILEDAPAEWADNRGASHRVANLALAVLISELSVVATPQELKPVSVAFPGSDGPARRTDVEFEAEFVVTGEQLVGQPFSFWGKTLAEGIPDPGVPAAVVGVPRFYTLMPRNGRIHPTGEPADWRVDSDGNVDLGYFQVSPADLKAMLDAVKEQ